MLDDAEMTERKTVSREPPKKPKKKKSKKDPNKLRLTCPLDLDFSNKFRVVQDRENLGRTDVIRYLLKVDEEYQKLLSEEGMQVLAEEVRKLLYPQAELADGDPRFREEEVEEDG